MTIQSGEMKITPLTDGTKSSIMRDMKIRNFETLSGDAYFRARPLPCIVRVMKAAPSNETIAWHDHDFAELVFVSSGSLKHMHRKTTVTLHAGDFFVIHPGLRHGYAEMTRNAVVYNLLFTESLRDVAHLVAASPLARHVFPQTDDDRRPDVLGTVTAAQGRRVVRLLEEIRIEERATSPSSPTCCGALFAAVLARLSSGCPQPDGKATAQDAKTALAPELDYMDAHLGEKVTMQELCGVTGRSPSALTRLFRDAFGTSPIDYLIERRLDRAELLKRTTRLPASRVAASCGFIDASHLARTFRRHRRTSTSLRQR